MGSKLTATLHPFKVNTASPIDFDSNYAKSCKPLDFVTARCEILVARKLRIFLDLTAKSADSHSMIVGLVLCHSLKLELG